MIGRAEVAERGVLRACPSNDEAAVDIRGAADVDVARDDNADEGGGISAGIGEAAHFDVGVGRFNGDGGIGGVVEGGDAVKLPGVGKGRVGGRSVRGQGAIECAASEVEIIALRKGDGSWRR